MRVVARLVVLTAQDSPPTGLASLNVVRKYVWIFVADIQTTSQGLRQILPNYLAALDQAVKCSPSPPCIS